MELWNAGRALQVWSVGGSTLDILEVWTMEASCRRGDTGYRHIEL